MLGVHEVYQELRGHRGAVQALAAAPQADTQTLLSGGEDGTVRLWDLRTQKSFCAAFAGGPVTSVTFGIEADARTVIAATGGSVVEFDMRNGDQVIYKSPSRTFDCGEPEVNGVAVHGQGRFVAAAADDGRVHVIERSTGRPQRRFRTTHDNIASCVRFRPGRTWEVLSGGLDCKLIRWDFSKGTPLQSFDLGAVTRTESASSAPMLNPPGVNALALTQSGRHAVSGLGDGSVIVTELQKGTHALLSRHTYSIADVALIGPEEQIVSAGNDKRLIVWHLTASTATSSDPSKPYDTRASSTLLPAKVNAMAGAAGSVAVATTEDAILLFKLQ